MPDPWSAPRTRLEKLITTPGTTVAQLVAQNPAEIEIDVDVRERTFDRRGYIDCERWVTKVSDEPCKLVAGHNTVPHQASIRMAEEEIRNVSQTMSARINVNLSQTVSTTVGSMVGASAPGVTSSVTISGTTSTTFGGGSEFVTSETVAQSIRSALDTQETIGLDAHLPVLCKRWRVPYGLELVVTVRGKAKVRRRWVQSLTNPQTIEWSSDVTVDLSGAQVDASVDPGIDTASSIVEDAPCDQCPDGSHLELRDDGTVVRVPGQRAEPRERPRQRQK